MVEFSIFAVTIVLASCPNGPDDKACAHREFCPLVYMLWHTARAYTHLGLALPRVTYYLHATQYFLFERVAYSLVLTQSILSVTPMPQPLLAQKPLAG